MPGVLGNTADMKSTTLFDVLLFVVMLAPNGSISTSTHIGH